MTYKVAKLNGSEPVFAASTFFKMDSIVKKARQMLELGFQKSGINLTADQWVLIERLKNAGVISQHHLACESFKDAGTTTRILDLLCKKGYTQRQPSTTDRRSLDVSLTDTGIEIFEKAKQESQKVKFKGFGTLCLEDFTTLNNLLKAVYSQLTTELKEM